MTSRALVLTEARKKLQSFEESIVDGIVSRILLQLKDRKYEEIELSPDYEECQVHTDTQIKVDLDESILDSYRTTILPIITGQTENRFGLQDQLLLDLIGCRIYYGTEIAEQKFLDKMSLFLEYYRHRYPMMPLVENPEVEHTVLKRVTHHKLIDRRLPSGWRTEGRQRIERVFAELIFLNKSVQIDYLNHRIERLRVGFLGPDGSYGSQVANHYFPDLSGLEAVANHRELFERLNEREFDLVVFPVRNSATGLIHEVDESKYYCVKMIDFKVEIDLLGHEGDTIDDLERVYSHPQAYAEAHAWVEQNIPEAEFIATESTSAASVMVKEDPHRSAALSSRRCAERLGLKVHAPTIATSTTTFFILGLLP